MVTNVRLSLQLCEASRVKDGGSRDERDLCELEDEAHPNVAGLRVSLEQLLLLARSTRERVEDHFDRERSIDARALAHA